MYYIRNNQVESAFDRNLRVLRKGEKADFLGFEIRKNPKESRKIRKNPKIRENLKKSQKIQKSLTKSREISKISKKSENPKSKVVFSNVFLLYSEVFRT